jgi:calcineurin-like phosphoesterase family protein
MQVYFTSDNHYFHDNIIKYCNRPFASSDDMNTEMISRWNSRVKPDDIGIFVGDVSAGLKKRHPELREIISRLNGNKILIRGNHDHQTNDWYVESGFLKVFDFLNLGGVIIRHFPMHENSNDLCFGNYSHIIHGHVHSNVPNFEKHFNVAVDRHDFYPVAYQQAIPIEFHEIFLTNLKALLTI